MSVVSFESQRFPQLRLSNHLLKFLENKIHFSPQDQS